MKLKILVVNLIIISRHRNSANICDIIIIVFANDVTGDDDLSIFLWKKYRAEM